MSESKQQITLGTSDGAEVKVGTSANNQLHCSATVSHAYQLIERVVAERSILIKNMLEDIGDEAVTEAIPIPNVSKMGRHCLNYSNMRR